MPRRGDQEVKQVLQEAAVACTAIMEKASERIKGLTIPEMLHAQLELPPNQLVGLVIFENRRSPTPFSLHCHVCKELLSQRSLQLWPVLAPRVDGSSFPCAIPLCDDEECRQRLSTQIEEGGL